jgi:hypothetical protein
MATISALAAAGAAAAAAAAGSGSFFGGRGGGRFGAGLQEFKRIAGIADGADVLQAGNLVALVIERGEQGAGRGGGALELRLVGLVGEEDIADRYRIADLLLPRAHDAGFDRDAFLRHDDGLRAGAVGLCCGSGGRGCGSLRRLGGSLGRSRALETCGLFAGLADRADVHEAGNLVAFVVENVEQRARRSGLALKLRFVGLIGEEDIADRYLVADLLLPCAHDARFDSNAFLRHQYAFCHN